MKMGAVIRATLLAPLVGPIFLTFLNVLLLFGQYLLQRVPPVPLNTWLLGSTLYLLFGIPVSYLLSLILAVPLVCLLHRLKLLCGGSVYICGAGVGIIATTFIFGGPACVLGFSSCKITNWGVVGWLFLLALPSFTLAGWLTAFVWWKWGGVHLVRDQANQAVGAGRRSS